MSWKSWDWYILLFLNQSKKNRISVSKLLMKNIIMKVDKRLFIFWNAIFFLDEREVGSIFIVEGLEIFLCKLRFIYTFVFESI